MIEDEASTELSTTHISLLDDDRLTYNQPLQSTSPIPSMQASYETDLLSVDAGIDIHVGDTSDRKSKSTTLTLKQYEKTIDSLKKDNFGLKMKIFYMEKRWEEASPDNNDKALKENVNLKVTVHSLTQELKRYKKMILELNSAIELIQSKPCPEIHGMTEQEREEMDTLKVKLEKYRDENDKLTKTIHDLSSENVKFRMALHSKTNNNTEEWMRVDMKDIEHKYKQALHKIEEQQRTIQSMQSMQQRGYGGQSNDHYVKSAYSDRDSIKSQSALRQLEDDLRIERIEKDALIDDLEEKKKYIHMLEDDLEQRSMALHDIKQKIRNKSIECEQLMEQLESIRIEKEEKEAMLQEENEELMNENQNREQEIAALENEIIKLLSHLEKKEEDEEDNDYMEQINLLKDRIEEREEEIEMLKNEIEEMSKCHDEDLHELEKHHIRTQAILKEKSMENNQLLMEFEEVIKNAELEAKNHADILNEMQVKLRDREVKLESMVGDHDATTDTMLREKNFLHEEINELQQELMKEREKRKENEMMVIDLKNCLNKKIREENMNSPSRMHKQHDFSDMEEKIKMLTDRLKREEAERREAQHIQRTLKYKLMSANEKTSLLHDLLDESKEKDKKSDNKAVQLYLKLNHELRKDLDDKEREMEKMRSQSDEYRELYNKQLEESTKLQKLVDKRETMLTHSLTTCDSLKEQQSLMENILYDQATGAYVSLRERAHSSMSSI
ncbi:microtubule associated-domain-containing protein [Pilobolus umbonatus]|nr:microtubule associated-domain-containing protein [Pilobolus umbonatus]